MKLDIIGAGAFGSALAISFADKGHDVTLWARDLSRFADRVPPRLPGVRLPEAIRLTEDPGELRAEHAVYAVPTQSLGAHLQRHPPCARVGISVAKGIDLATGLGPAGTLAQHVPIVAQLTGPSFAADLARGLPTALTLACGDPETARVLQEALSTPSLRLYRSADVIGAELGGALKNVIAIAAGAVIGAGLGESARAALIARGFAEMLGYATHRGADPDTLGGLSGLGDLVLTCGSEQSRNFRAGVALARGEGVDSAITVEGIHTARQLSKTPQETPIADTVAALADGRMDVAGAIAQLLSRPLKPEKP